MVSGSRAVRIEYKRDLGNGNSALEAIAALASTFGGVVLMGVDEDDRGRTASRGLRSKGSAFTGIRSGHHGAMSAGLNAEEWGYLIELLQRFAENDLDQHDTWRFETSYGPVYVRLSRERGEDEPAEAFRLVEPPSPYRTGRAAHVSDLSGVRSREDVLRIIGEMAADLEGGGAAAWENGTLARFLEAYGGFLGDLDGYFANRREQMPAQPDWELLATLLVAASGYE